MKKRGKATLVAICLCAIFCTLLCSIRVNAEGINPSSEENNKELGEPVIVVQVIQTEVTTYVYKDGKAQQVGEPREIATPYYIAKEGETVQSIAKKLQISPEALLAVNEDYKPLEDGTYPPFTEYAYVEIPKVDWNEVSGKVYYYVEKGDTLSKISDYFGIEIQDIIQCNNQETSIFVCKNESIYRNEDTNMYDANYLVKVKQSMSMMDNAQESIWCISPQIQDLIWIYAGDFISLK